MIVAQSDAASRAVANTGAALADRNGRPGAMPGGSSGAPTVQSVSQTHSPTTSSKCCAPQREMPGHWYAALHILRKHREEDRDSQPSCSG